MSTVNANENLIVYCNNQKNSINDQILNYQNLIVSNGASIDELNGRISTLESQTLTYEGLIEECTGDLTKLDQIIAILQTT